MDLTQFVALGAIIAGMVELITRIRAHDYWVVATIITSVAIGAVFGAVHYYPSLDVVSGMMFGFGASGAISAIGASRSTPAPSDVTTKVS